MKKIKVSLALLTMILFSFFLAGCSGSPEAVLEKAMEKNKEINYAKQNVDATIEMAGVNMNIKITGETDSKNKKSIMNVKTDASALGASSQNMEMYVDDKTMYVKDPNSDKYIKTTLEDTQAMDTSKGFASSAMEELKSDTKVKETVKVENGDNSDKIVSAEVGTETVKKILNNVMKSQLGSMNSEMGNVTEQMDKLDIENMKYKGTVNKEGFLYGEEMSFDIKEKQSGLTLKMTLKSKSTDINEDKTVELPEIPKNKIVEQKLK